MIYFALVASVDCYYSAGKLFGLSYSITFLLSDSWNMNSNIPLSFRTPSAPSKEKNLIKWQCEGEILQVIRIPFEFIFLSWRRRMSSFPAKSLIKFHLKYLHLNWLILKSLPRPLTPSTQEMTNRFNGPDDEDYLTWFSACSVGTGASQASLKALRAKDRGVCRPPRKDADLSPYIWPNRVIIDQGRCKAHPLGPGRVGD